MNILQIIANKGWGGGEKYVWELVCQLTNNGHNVSIVIPSCNILSLKFIEFQTHTINFHGPYDIVAIHTLAQLIKQNDIQIVHTHIFKHTMAALLARELYKLPIKVVMTRHLCKPAKTSLHYPWLYRHVDQLIFVSEYAKSTFFSSNPPIDIHKTIVIHNSVIPDNKLLPTEYRQALRLDDNKFLIGFAGTITPHKGVGFLIDLAVQLNKITQDIIFIIAGQTPPGKTQYMAELQREIERHGLQKTIHFIGFIDHTISFFRQMDAIIIPTLKPESFGLVVIEAMIAQRPILFSEHILPEVITSNEGQPIDTQNIKRSVQQVLDLKNNPSKQKELTEHAHKKWLESFSYDRFLKQILNIYNR